MCPMVGHVVWGGQCGVDGQIAGWYKGNEGGAELTRFGGAVGWVGTVGRRREVWGGGWAVGVGVGGRWGRVCEYVCGGGGCGGG